MGNKHLYTKQCHLQNYQNYEQSQQKLGTILVSWSPNQTFFTEFFLERFDQFQTLKNDFETQNFEIFDKVVHNFGKPGKVIIQ